MLLKEADSDKDILHDGKIFSRPKFVNSQQRIVKFRDMPHSVHRQLEIKTQGALVRATAQQQAQDRTDG